MGPGANTEQAEPDMGAKDAAVVMGEKATIHENITID